MATPAGRLNHLLTQLRDERDGLAEARTNAEAAAIERAPNFDEDAARRELGRAVALDAAEGTDTATALSERIDAERAKVAKETAAVVKRREAARKTLDEIDRKTADLSAQIEECEQLLAAETAREGKSLTAYAIEAYCAAAQEYVRAYARVAAAHAMAHADIPHEAEPLPFVALIQTHWRDDIAIPGGVDTGRGLIEVAEDVTGPMVREFHKTMVAGLLGMDPGQAGA